MRMCGDCIKRKALFLMTVWELHLSYVTFNSGILTHLSHPEAVSVLVEIAWVLLFSGFSGHSSVMFPVRINLHPK